MIDLRPVTGDDWRTWRSVRLAALAEAPHAFGSVLADWQGSGDTEARWRARLEQVPFNVVALVDGVTAGQASGTMPDEYGQSELISMWVAPSARGRGVGEALIDRVDAWATAIGAQWLVLSVKTANSRAVALYQRVGFELAPDQAAEPGERTMRRPVRPTAR